MSLDPILWALKDAPVADSLERLVLVALAERAARADGCTAFPSRDTLAAVTLADPKTVQRVLRRLEQRRLIARGDQSAARYLRADRRPVVWDLLIPYSWFPNPERMNAERVQAGLPPLTPETRPDIPPAPERKRRSDAGKPRVSPVTKRGDSESPRRGGTASPERGDWESRTGGLEAPRYTPVIPPENPPSPQPPVEQEPTAAADGRGGGGGAAQHRDNVAAAVFVDALPYGNRVPGARQRTELVRAVEAAFAAGWSEAALHRQLTAETANVRSLVGVYRHRLAELPEPESMQSGRSAGTWTPPPVAEALEEARRRAECEGRNGLCGRPLRPGQVLCGWCAAEAVPARP